MQEGKILKKTAVAYQRRAHQLYLKAYQLNGGQVSVAQLTDYLLGKRTSVCKSSWRLYRASIIYALKQRSLQLRNGSDDEIKAAINRLSTASLTDCPRAKWTSSSRRKELTPEMMVVLSNNLRKATQSQRKNGVCLQTFYFLWAGSFTGIRPCEWEQAVLGQQDGQNYLRVLTAKQNPQECPVFRDIPISSDHKLTLISKHLHLIEIWCQGGRGTFENYIQACRSCLRRAVVKEFGENMHVVLYDGRHQYSSNLRSEGVSEDVVAARLGHKTTKTTRSYGKKKGAAWGGKQIIRARKTSTPHSGPSSSFTSMSHHA